MDIRDVKVGMLCRAKAGYMFETDNTLVRVIHINGSLIRCKIISNYSPLYEDKISQRDEYVYSAEDLELAHIDSF